MHRRPESSAQPRLGRVKPRSHDRSGRGCRYKTKDAAFAPQIASHWRAVSIGHDGDDEHGGFSDFTLWPTKRQSSVPPVRSSLLSDRARNPTFGRLRSRACKAAWRIGRVRQRSIIPRRTAMVTACVRSPTSSLAKMFFKCAFTVSSDREST